MWSLGDRFRKIRRDVLKGSQADMAAMLGVPTSAYQNWEAGKSNPRQLVPLARRIEREIGVPATWILGMGATADLPKSAGMATLQALLEEQISEITDPVVRRFAEEGVAVRLASAAGTSVEDELTTPITQRRYRINATCYRSSGQRIAVLPTGGTRLTPIERRPAA